MNDPRQVRAVVLDRRPEMLDGIRLADEERIPAQEEVRLRKGPVRPAGNLRVCNGRVVISLSVLPPGKMAETVRDSPALVAPLPRLPQREKPLSLVLSIEHLGAIYGT